MRISKQPPEQEARAPNTRSDGFSPIWLLNMVITYVSATLFLQQVLGTPGMVEQWRAEKLVPQLFHIVTSVTFGTAFLLDILAAAFYLDSSRLEFTLLPAWIKGAPFVSSVLMLWGKNVMTQSATGKIVNLQRYICWMHTAPAMMYLIKSVSTGITSKQLLGIIVLHEIQLGLGAVAKLVGGYTEVVLGVAVHAALVPVLMLLHRGLKDVGVHYSKNIARFVYIFTVVTYGSFGIVWDLDAFNLVTPAQEEAMYLLAEFASKILYSTVLMFSNFKTAELRRIMIMRSIEVASQQQLIEHLKGLVDQKDQFLGAVSHELRTPLNGIIVLSEAALVNSDAADAGTAASVTGMPSTTRPEPLAPSTKNQFALIRSSGLRLLHLVNDILDATALAHNRLVLQQQKVVLRPLCQEVADITRATLKPGVVLHCSVPDGLEVLGDQDRIVQVLNNLVRNAVKFTPKGSITLSAAYGVQQMPLLPDASSSSSDQQQQQRPVVSVSVKDTGYGIPSDKLEAIFLPFEQVHPHESRSQRGLGLGLSIVHRLVTAMGGTITVSSSAERGSTFTFTLPAYAEGDERAAAAAARAGAIGSSLGRMVPDSSGSSSGAWSKAALLMEPGTPTRSHSNAAAADAAAAAMAAAAKCAGRSADSFEGISLERFKRSLDQDLRSDTAAAAAGSSGFQQQQQENISPGDSDSDSDDWPTAHAPHHEVDQMFAAATAASASSSRISAEVTGCITCQQFYSSADHGQRQLLVVDDDETNHQVLSLLLGSAGYVLIHTYSGAETLKYLNSCDVLPDMILLDAAMPGMDGRQVCRRVRSLMSGSPLHLPIVMLTAQVSAAAVDASMAAGADDHLGKPFSRSELMNVITANLAKQKRC